VNTVKRIEEGQFKDGLLDGFGRIMDDSGYVMVGYFKKGKPYGKM